MSVPTISPGGGPGAGECPRRGGRRHPADTPASWDALMAPLADATEKLAGCGDPVSHLNAVVNTPELREACNSNLGQTVPSFTPSLGKTWRCSPRSGAGRQRRLRQAERGAPPDHRAPAARRLPPVGRRIARRRKTCFAEIQARLSELSARFSQNVLTPPTVCPLYRRRG